MQLRNLWGIALWSLLSCSTGPSPVPRERWVKEKLPTNHVLVEIRQLEDRLVAVDDHGAILSRKRLGSAWEMLGDQGVGSAELPAAFVLDDQHLWAAKGYATDEDVEPLVFYHSSLADPRWKASPITTFHRLRVQQLHFWDDRNGVMLAWQHVRWGGCRRTSDGGETWIELDWPISSGCVLDRQEIWGIGKAGLFHTQDGGKTWDKTLSRNGLRREEMRDADPCIDGVYFVDKNRGWAYGDQAAPDKGMAPFLSATKDGGKTWSPAQFIAAPGCDQKVTQVLANSSAAVWVAIEEWSRDKEGPQTGRWSILRSDDDGRTWSTEWSGPDYLGHWGVTADGSLCISCGHGFLLSRGATKN